MKALEGAINQEKALLARGLLRDCEIFTNLRLKLYSAHVLGHEAARYKLLQEFVSPAPRLLEGDSICSTLGNNVQCNDNYQDQAAAAVARVHATLY